MKTSYLQSIAAALLLAAMTTLTAPLTFAQRRTGESTASRPEVAQDLYFVAFRSGQTADHEKVVAASGGLVQKRFPKLRTLSARLTAEQVSKLEQHPMVSYVEPVPMRYPQGLGDAQLTPAMNNGLYGLITTNTINVHSLGITGVGVNVGVADTGLDYSHPDIAPSYRGGVDTVGVGDSDPHWNNDIQESHGTHVAGTILAASNSVGILGVAPNANLYHARVLGPNGGTSADVMEGVEWLVETAACKIVNLSLGGGRPSRTEQAFYAQMLAQGALIVAASGNNGTLVRPHFPASYVSNIAVGAVDQNNQRAIFSNAFVGLDVVAPGVDILSSVPVGTGNVDVDWDTYAGTSMAAPHVSGVLALIWAANPALTNIQAMDMLYNTTTDLGDPGIDSKYGRGIVNAAAAVALAQSN